MLTHWSHKLSTIRTSPSDDLTGSYLSYGITSLIHRRLAFVSHDPTSSYSPYDLTGPIYRGVASVARILPKTALGVSFLSSCINRSERKSSRFLGIRWHFCLCETLLRSIKMIAPTN